MAIHTSFVQLATAMIAVHGRQVTLIRREVVEGEDEERPWRVDSPEETPEVVRALFLDYGARQMEGMDIRAGDKRCLIAAEGVAEPTTKDLIQDSGGATDRWTIHRCGTLQPGDSPIIYDLQVRR